MTEHNLRREQQLTILKHLTTGKNVDVVATITHIDRDVVLEFGRTHGYPDREQLGWAADLLEKEIEEQRRNRLPAGGQTRGESIDSPDSHSPAPRPSTPSRPASPTPASAASASGTSAGAAPVDAQPPSKPDEFRILINTAKNHDRKRIQNLASKILEDCAKLRGWIDEEQQAFKARQAAAAEKEQARAEVKRLKEELAAAKAKLRPAKPDTPENADPGDGPTAAEIRAWAAANDIDCPSRGRVPAEVRQAYDAANDLEEAS